ncbi:MAG: VWA domain-containing protein, partial [Vicinamibacterales bacterium]|nr:VWA domain-containing protein [Vicinamibacterales bacterium]
MKRTGDRGSGTAVAVFVAAVIFICVTGGPLAAQPPEQPRPAFETRAELVLVDVTVLDRGGKPVDSLTIDDFDVQVNGRPRPVESVQYISTGAATAAATATARDAFSSSNDAPSTGRLLLIVVDEGSIRFGGARVVTNAATALMDRLAPGDLVGLVRLPSGVGGVEFTADRQRITDALAKVTGQATSMGMAQRVYVSEAVALERGGFEWQQAVARECGDAGALANECEQSLVGDARSLLAEQTGRTFQTVRALEGLFERLIPLRTPTTLVLISEGLLIATERTPMTRLARLAAEARATVQIVQPSQGAFSMEANAAPYSMWDESLMVEGLEQLAGQTAGGLHRIAGGSGAGVFDRLSMELTGYYLLGFTPSDDDRTGRDRRIRVNVRPRGLTVRARPTFAIRDTATADDAVTLAPAEHLMSLLAAPLPNGALPMRVATYVSTSSEAGKVRLTVAAEVGEPATEGQRLPVALLLLDKEDRVVARGDFTPDAQPVSPDEASPRLVLTSLLVEPGDYTLRLAALDGARGGSVYHSVTARLQPLRGGITASDIVLTGASLRRGDTPRPTAAGFLRTQAMTAMLEVEGAADVVRRTTMALEIATAADAPVLVRAEARHSDRAGGRQRAFEAAIDAAVLPPGEYVARAVVAVPGQPVQYVIRPLRLEPPSAARVAEAAAARA